MHLREQLAHALETDAPEAAADEIWRRGYELQLMRWLYQRHNYRADHQYMLTKLDMQHRRTVGELRAAAWTWRDQRADAVVDRLRSKTGASALDELRGVLAEMPWHAGAHALLAEARGLDPEKACGLSARYRFRHVRTLRAPGISIPLGLRCDPAGGGLFVGDRDARAVLRLEADGASCTQVLGDLDDPRSLDFDKDGTLWVAETKGKHLWSVDRDGRTNHVPLADLLPPDSPSMPLSVLAMGENLHVLLMDPSYANQTLVCLALPDLRVVSRTPLNVGTLWELAAGTGGMLGFFRPAGPVLRSCDGTNWEALSDVRFPVPLRMGRQFGNSLFVVAGHCISRLDSAGNLVWRAHLDHFFRKPSSITSCDLMDELDGPLLHVADPAQAAIHVFGI